MIALIVVSILIYFGVAHRVLDRMRLSDKSALAVIAAIIIGSFIDIPVTARLNHKRWRVYCGNTGYICAPGARDIYLKKLGPLLRLW
jgi:uncharacterized membrane protein